jgi:hypothetical protein
MLYRVSEATTLTFMKPLEKNFYEELGFYKVL